MFCIEFHLSFNTLVIIRSELCSWANWFKVKRSYKTLHKADSSPICSVCKWHDISAKNQIRIENQTMHSMKRKLYKANNTYIVTKLSVPSSKKTCTEFREAFKIYTNIWSIINKPSHFLYNIIYSLASPKLKKWTWRFNSSLRQNWQKM